MKRQLSVLGYILNSLLALWLVLGCVYLALVMSLQSLIIAAITLVLLVLVLRRQRWGYFGAAMWGLASYQLAKEGWLLADIKRLAMVSGMVVVVVSVLLHEIFCRRSAA